MRRLASTVALAALLALSCAALAQKTTTVSSNDPVHTRPAMPIIDVNFPGGTVAEFVKSVQAAAMESAAKTPVNVMLPEEAGAVRLPAVSLKRASAETALETLRFAFSVKDGPQFESRNMTSDGDEGLTFAIQYMPARSPSSMQPGMPVQTPVSQAYSLRDLIQTPQGLPQGDDSLRMSPESVLGALKLAAELEAGDDRVAPTQLLFHPDTQLLIARGTGDQHRLIESVLAQLNDTLMQRREQFSDVQSRDHNDALQKLDFEAQVNAAEANVRRAESELGPATSEVERLEKMFTAGNVSESELERARANLQVARANFESARSQVEYMRRRFELVQQSRGGGGDASLTPADNMLVIYDLRDLASFKSDFFDLVKQVIKPTGKMTVTPISGDSSGSIAVSATRPQHEILVAVFNTARRLKANEPKLPGMTLDGLIQKTKE